VSIGNMTTFHGTNIPTVTRSERF